MRFFLLVCLAACADTSSMPQGRSIGAACSVGSDCASGECLTQPQFVGGYCSVRDCQTLDSGGCPANAECSGGGGIATLGCFVHCSANGDCRSGYHCCPAVTTGVKVCVPATGTPMSC